MRRVYGAIIRKSEDGYWAEVPDLPGCFGQGETFLEAVTSAANGIETHLAALVEYGRKIPEATCIRSDSGDVVYVCADDSSVCLGEPIMTAADAARQLGVTPGRVSQLITAGKLVAERMAGGTWVAVSSVEEYSRSTRSPGRPKKAALA